jgi:hypothetical protein
MASLEVLARSFSNTLILTAPQVTRLDLSSPYQGWLSRVTGNIYRSRALHSWKPQVSQCRWWKRSYGCRVRHWLASLASTRWSLHTAPTTRRQLCLYSLASERLSRIILYQRWAQVWKRAEKCAGPHLGDGIVEHTKRFEKSRLVSARNAQCGPKALTSGQCSTFSWVHVAIFQAFVHTSSRPWIM